MTGEESAARDRRIAEQCYAALDQLHEIETETDEQAERLETAIESVERIAMIDKDRHGEPPTDKLIRALQNRKEGT